MRIKVMAYLTIVKMSIHILALFLAEIDVPQSPTSSEYSMTATQIFKI